MNDAGNPSENGQKNVYQKIGTTSSFEEDTNRRQKDGEEDFADIRRCERLRTIFIHVIQISEGMTRVAPQKRK